MTARYADFDWSETRQAHEAFWGDELDRPLILISGTTPEASHCRTQYRYIPAYGDRPIAEIVDIAEENLQCTWYAGDGYPQVFANYGAGSAAAYVGLATPEYQETGGVWFHPVSRSSVRDTRIVPRTDTHWFGHTQQYMRAMVDRLGEKTQITLPDLGGMLDVLASIRTTEQLLVELIECPEEIERLLDELFEAWWFYYEHFDRITRGRCPGSRSWAPVWSPRRTYMFQSDFSYMISPAMFERFVVPELTRSCGRVDHGFYHMDGIGQLGHLDLLLGIDNLRGIQWVPGEGKPNPAQWPGVFERIRSAGKFVQTWALDPGETFDVIDYTRGGRGVIIEVRGVDEAGADAFVQKVDRAVWRHRRRGLVQPR